MGEADVKMEAGAATEVDVTDEATTDTGGLLKRENN